MLHIAGEKKTSGCLAIVRQMLTCEPDAIQALHGMVHNIKNMTDFSFIQLRLSDAVIQCVQDQETVIKMRTEDQLKEAAPMNLPIQVDQMGQPVQSDQPEREIRLQNEMAVAVTGKLRPEPRAPHGFELVLRSVVVLSIPAQQRPLPLAKKKNQVSLEILLNLRPISLRHPMQRHLFKLQEGICRSFRLFLTQEGFTEIHTPKITASGAEGGSKIFKLDYFGQKAYLAQSPQLYKQMMVGVYERVFETGPVFRAEKHNTTRHLNEYTSLDFEMGFISSFYDVIEMETAFLQAMVSHLKTTCADALQALNISLTCPVKIPAIRFSEAKDKLMARHRDLVKDPYDLEPEEERLIGQMIHEETGSDFVFITHYPAKKRPFYTMEDPVDPKYSLSFDLLYKGLEITTGGQRIHDYQQQVDKMIRLGMHPEHFTSWLQIHACGMPPHGGLGIGLERLLMQMTGLDNIKKAALFPRDLSRLEP